MAIQMGRLLLLLLLLASAAGAALFQSSVLCSGTKCGDMEIDVYRTILGNVDRSENSWLGGVRIEGQFKPLPGVLTKPAQYVQAVQIDTTDAIRWLLDRTVPLPVPGLDPPPGGVKPKGSASDAGYNGNDNPHDFEPWYNPAGGAFPFFVDEPRVNLLLAKEKDLLVSFETWLVCVVVNIPNDPNVAQDGFYDIAPMLGWNWGYKITYKDAGVIGTDEIEDFNVTALDFQWISPAPTGYWTAALRAVYGSTPSDRWFIELSDCAACRPVPEPPTGASTLLVLCFAALPVSRWLLGIPR